MKERDEGRDRDKQNKTEREKKGGIEINRTKQKDRGREKWINRKNRGR